MAGKRFPDKEWKKIVEIIAESFAMDDARKTRLAENSTAKLIAALPYLAGCREPRRTALSHLATYVIAASPAGAASFDHKEGDNYDVLARLAPIAHFEGGNPTVINRGMKLLAMAMIGGYKRDKASDKEKGLYNPVLEGKWSDKEKLGSLKSAVASTADEEMDSIVSVDSAVGLWWGV